MDEKTTPNPDESGNEPDYIKVIQDLKATTVPKTEHDKLKLQNKQLLDTLVRGETIDTQDEDKRTIPEIRKKLMGNGPSSLTNMDFATDSLALRQKVIDSGGVDPFLPYGAKIMPTEEDIAASERVATVLQECIEYADGDRQLFTSELQRRMVDAAPMVRRRN